MALIPLLAWWLLFPRWWLSFSCWPGGSYSLVGLVALIPLAVVDQNLGAFWQNLGDSWQNLASENATAFAKYNVKKS